jgi:phenylacetate-CoA ligase
MLEQDLQYSVTAELYLRNNFDIQHRSTLYIDSFAMGAWIGGVFTYEAIRLLAERGKYNISIITPGIFKEEIIKAVKNLGPNFDQVIIGGYPPFIKDIIDEGIKSGIDWKKRKIGIVFSAEGFTEKFRDYLYERIGVDNPYLASLNHYGTADMGTMSHETPLSILVRRKAIENKKLCESIFSLNNRTPTFTQYDPTLFFFQKTNDILCCSGYSGIPFIRYDFKDNGGIYTISEIEQKFNDIGMNLNEEIKQAKISNTIWNIPFVYVFERNDFTVKLYGANIFPETIRHALQQKRFEKYVTGKFTMYINFDEDQNQFLEINIELMKGIDIQEELADKIQKAIVVRLLEENSEYKSNYRSNPPRQTPKIDLWTYEDPNFFRPGGKQKWIKK